MSLEAASISQITAEPENPLHRLVYADWLEEQGDARAELLRIQDQLRTPDVPNRPQVEARMLDLLKQGVQPLTITPTSSLVVKLVLIFPGQFRLGSPLDEAPWIRNEGQVEVTLTRSFWLGQYVVTQLQWGQVMGTCPWRGNPVVREGDQYPATCVSWGDASLFCRKLTALEQPPPGWKYALPTEAQWEYACRAGTTTPYSFGVRGILRPNEEWLYAWWGAEVDDDGEASHTGPSEVGLLRPNPWGLHDMHGNVGEWCRDWYVDQHPGGTDPELQAETDGRVQRGIGYHTFLGNNRSAIRLSETPDTRHSSLGFRVALIPVR